MRPLMLALAMAGAVMGCPDDDASSDADGAAADTGVSDSPVTSIDTVSDGTVDTIDADTVDADTADADTVDADTVDADTVETTDTTDAAPTEGPSSEDLVIAAFERGELDEESALRYRVFAAFGDERLPTPYRGAPSSIGSHVMLEVYGAWARLGQATRDELYPFFQPPPLAVSWFARQSGAPAAPDLAEYCRLDEQHPYAGVDGTHVKVWYRLRPDEPALVAEDAALAERMRDAVDEYVWGQISSRLGILPASDDGVRCVGDGPEIDIYIVDELDSVGLTTPVFKLPSDQPVCGNPIPTFITVRRDAMYAEAARHPDGPLWTVAHELMHAVQKAAAWPDNCTIEPWWDEATATWFGDRVYPLPQIEHDYVRDYLDVPDAILLRPPSQAFSYGAYLFPSYLVRSGGDAAVAGVFTRLVGGTAKLIDAVPPSLPTGTWEIDWHAFGKALWNADHHATFTGDEMYQQPRWTDDVAVELDASGAFERRYEGADIGVGALGNRYWRFTFPDEVRSIELKNPYAKANVATGDPDFDVSALLVFPPAARGGPSRDALLTASEERSFCRALGGAEEDLQTLGIVASNHEHVRFFSTMPMSGNASYAKPGDPLIVRASNIHCGAWTGSVIRQGEYSYSINTDEGPIVNTERYDITVDVVLEPVDELTAMPGLLQGFLDAIEDIDGGARYWVVAGGHIEYLHRVTLEAPTGGCVTEATASVGMPADSGFMIVLTLGDQQRGGVFMMGHSHFTVDETSTCGAGGTLQTEIDLGWLSLAPEPDGGGDYVSDDGLRIEGERTDDEPIPNASHMSWIFVPKDPD